MKALIQRVSSGSVIVENKTVGSIQKGLVVLLGVTHSDSEKDIVHYIDTIIPDAYQINIELKSLIPDSKNLFYHSALGSGTLGRGIYSTSIQK